MSLVPWFVWCIWTVMGWELRAEPPAPVLEAVVTVLVASGDTWLTPPAPGHGTMSNHCELFMFLTKLNV